MTGNTCLLQLPRLLQLLLLPLLTVTLALMRPCQQ
jgi:hypothetical protein